MSSAVAAIRQANIVAGAAVLVIFLGLLAYGANSAALAALLALLLLALLAGTLLLVRPGVIADGVAANRLPLAAALAFVAWSLLTAAPVLPALAHPLARTLGQQPLTISLSPFRTIEGVVAFLGPASAFAIGVLTAQDRHQRDWTARWILFASVPYTMIAAALFFRSHALGNTRLDAGVSSANAAATLFGFLILIAIAFIARGATGRIGERRNWSGGMAWAGVLLNTPIAVCALMLSFSAILLSASRGGLIALCVAAVALSAMLVSARLRSMQLRSGATILAAVSILALLGYFFFRGGEEVMGRFATAAQGAEARETLLRAHWQAFLQRPLFGHGLNTFHEINSLAATPETWRALLPVGAAHNIFVQLLEETGLVGALLFLGMLAPLMTRAVVRLRQHRSGAEWSAAALAMTILAGVHGMVDFGLQVPAIGALYAFALGAFVGAPSPRASSKSQATPETAESPDAA